LSHPAFSGRNLLREGRFHPQTKTCQGLAASTELGSWFDAVATPLLPLFVSGLGLMGVLGKGFARSSKSLARIHKSRMRSKATKKQNRYRNGQNDEKMRQM
jgi:hypothetical protein